ncbi:MAG: LysR family transcriptional regulator [Sphingosinicella sp.]|nr:LysR family transcriptional regulator [Sphingosinicella sp.]
MQRTNGNFDLGLLAALDVLLDTMSVTQAGVRIGLSQPAMSRTLARLRDAFDDRLLVRDGARLQRTPRAENLREPVKRLLRDATALYSAPIFDPAVAVRNFRAAIPDVVAAVILPALVTKLRGDAPHCRLTIIPWPGPGEPRQEIDFAIATDPDIFPGYRMERLFEDRDVLAFAGDHSPPRGNEILSRGHVAVVATGQAEDLADRWLGQMGLARSISATVPHYLQALHLVGRSDLMAILPSRLVETLGRPLGITSAELPFDQEPDQQWLLYPPHLSDDLGLKWLRRLLHQIMGAPGSQGDAI